MHHAVDATARRHRRQSAALQLCLHSGARALPVAAYSAAEREAPAAICPLMAEHDARDVFCVRPPP